MLDLVSALTPEQAARVRLLRTLLPWPVLSAASAGTAVSGLLLVALGQGLRRQKRRAWRAAVLLLALSTVLHLAKGLDVEEASATVLLTVVLVSYRDHFYAAGDPRTRLLAPLAMAVMLLVSCSVGLALLAARSGSIIGHPSLTDRIQQVLYGLMGARGPVRFRDDQTADVVFAILLALGCATLLVTSCLLLRAPEPTGHLKECEEHELRGLLACHGWRDSLGYFALRRDRSVLFSPSRKAAISYRVVSGVMLAAGDPVGDPEAWPGAVSEFLALASAHAWTPAVLGCGERAGQLWVRQAGMRALELGDEAIIQVDRFSLEGRAMRNVRQMVHRVQRLGYVTRVRRVAEIAPAELEDIRRQADAWRGAETERGFSMALGRFGDPADGECVAVTAHDGDRLLAVLHFVPWGPDGLSLDLMRRSRDAEPGLNELLIVETVRAAAALGIRRLSLNFAVFRSALQRGSELGAGPIARWWRSALLVASRWFQIESLFRFNAKFRPHWTPRFVCYRRASELPRVALSALEAEAFLVAPTRRRQTAAQASEAQPSVPAPAAASAMRERSPVGLRQVVGDRARAGHDH